MHAVADRLPEVSGHDKWIGKTGRRVVVTLFPGLVVKGVHDAAGTLLRILSIFLSSLQDCFLIFLRLGEDLCRKLVVAIAV